MGVDVIWSIICLSLAHSFCLVCKGINVKVLGTDGKTEVKVSHVPYDKIYLKMIHAL